MRTVACVLTAFSLLLSGALLGAEGEAVYTVIVNTANPRNVLKHSQVSAYFLKRQLSWQDGTPVVPVDQSIMSPIRVAFSTQVLGKSILGVQAYWQEQIFSGRDVPPPVKTSDGEVAAFVQANPGAIGYVSAGVSLPDGAKVLKIEE